MSITIAIVDDNPLLIKSLTQNLQLFDDLHVLFSSSNGVDLLRKLEENMLPQVLLLDIEMPQMNGIQTAYEIYKRYGDTVKIIMLTVFDQEDKIFAAIQAGASGYLMKDEKPSAIINAVNDVINGGSPMSLNIATKILGLLRMKPAISPTLTLQPVVTPQDFDLTKREIEILILIAKGFAYKKIAEELFLSERTIKKHVENIYHKLHVHTKFEAVSFAQRYNWVERPY